MTTKKPRAARPTRSQRVSGRTADSIVIDDMTTDDLASLSKSIDALIDRMMPLHLTACSRPGCVDPVVTVIHDGREDHFERLCSKHTDVVILALKNVTRAERELAARRRQQDRFDRLEPAMQYALEGR